MIGSVQNRGLKMEFIIGGIAIIICIFLAGFFMKKKYYKEMDRLEAWKIEISTRPVLNEMQKVKQLNMNGQTEERFERWRGIWDEIQTVLLPDLEELWFDAEEHIDKCRFKKVKEVQASIAQELTNMAGKIDLLLSELQELIGSEEMNRVEIEELKDIYRECKKMLLAHRHSFGKTEKHLEKRLEDVSGIFIQFDENTESGNYIAAREIVLTIKAKLEKTKRDMDLIPNILLECKTTIPSQLLELKDGYKEMLSQGYLLEHVQLEKESERIIRELDECLKQVEQADIEDVQMKIDEWKESIDILYDLLENEVLSKHEIKQRDHEILEMLYSAREANKTLNDEIMQIKQIYHLQEGDFGITGNLVKRLDQLFKRFELIEFKINENQTSYSHLCEELSVIKTLLESITLEQSSFLEKIRALRKDELTAREQLKQLKKKIADTIRLVSKSNIPGVPNEYKYLMEDARGSIQQVIGKLDEKPLDIPVVQQYLEVAILTVEKVTHTTDELFEMVKLAEKAIQYGNRYRSQYSTVDKGLYEAEQFFRSFQYKKAFEQAASSIEKVDPNALKKIETLL
jgi:septation ring formation regulator